MRKLIAYAVQGAALKNPSARSLAVNLPIDGDGHTISNKILLSLSHSEFDRLLPKLEFVRFKLRQVVHEAGETIRSGYFVNSGLMSVLAVQPDGKSVEVGLVGSEGFIGLPLIVGYRSSPTRVVTVGDATAYRCDVEALNLLLSLCPDLVRQLHRFSQRLAMQTTQIAACNRLHGVVERLARWILMSQDRIHAHTLPLTQELLAQMLGARRSSVTVSAGILQKAGMISCTRGSVTILNRHKLIAAACDCYEMVQRQLTEWESEAD
ncbi:MAG: Crp/Fnr family transcriptional regulator [Candidatus Acidiferrum sp.]